MILDERAHPEQGFRACLGIVRLARYYGPQRLDAAGTRGIDIGARTYGSVKSILANDLDRRPSPEPAAADPDPASQHPRAALLQLGDHALLTHPTLDQLYALGLHGMAKAFADIEAGGDAASLSHAEWLALLLDREAHCDATSGSRSRLRYAKLRQQACVEDIDYRARAASTAACCRSSSKATGSTPRQSADLRARPASARAGSPRALGHKACRDNRSVLYQRVPRLFADLALARGDGRYPRLLRALGRVDLLILDDWGLEPLDAAARHDLLEILEDRYGRRSTIVTSQLPVDQWHDVIGDPTYADAVLDRLVHNAHRIDLTGESLRRTRKPGRKA